MSSPYLPIMPISKVISRISLQRVLVKELQGIQQIEDRIYSWPHGLEFKGSHFTQPIPGQAAQILGCLHLQHRREMLLGWRHVAGSTGEGEAVYGSAGPGDRTRWSGADSPRKAHQSSVGFYQRPCIMLFLQYSLAVLSISVASMLPSGPSFDVISCSEKPFNSCHSSFQICLWKFTKTVFSQPLVKTSVIIYTDSHRCRLDEGLHR